MQLPYPAASDEIMAPLFEIADNYDLAAPWTTLSNSQPFCVCAKPGAEPVPCVAMGAGGDVFGIAIYPDEDGRRTFEWMRTGDVGLVHEERHRIRTASLTFSDRKELSPDALKQIKRLGRTYRGAGAWPDFQSYIPGYLPWLLTEDDAYHLGLAMRAAVHLALAGVRGKPVPEDDDERVPHVTFGGKGGMKVDVRPLAPHPPPRPLPMLPADEALVARLRKDCRKASSIWEMGAFASEMVVAERGQRPYMTTIALLVDAEQHLILHNQLLKPTELPDGILHTLTQAIDYNGSIPAEVRIADDTVAAIAGQTLKALGIRLRRAKCLHVEDVHEGLMRHLDNME